jgi:transcriptional regulator NrdR family protein
MRVRRCVNCNTRYSTVEVSVGRRVMSKAAAAAIRHVELVGD